MEKLELKHIVGYLPYVLKIRAFREGQILFIEDIIISGEFLDYLFEKTHARINSKMIYKPILRPLSDLTKEIEEDVIVYNKLSRRSQSDFAYEEPSVLKWAYDDIQILLEYNFDIHDLIGKGLAIDINTLK